MSLQVISSGFYSTIQDLGRFNFAEFGVPKSGFMDTYAAKKANLLVGNSQNKALLEITMKGPKLKFNKNALVAVSGLGAELFLNNKPKEINLAFEVQKNEVLEIGKITKGFRGYLAISGGFQTTEFLESKSYYKPLTPNNRIQDTQQLDFPDFIHNNKEKHSGVKFNKNRYKSADIEVFKGPEWAVLEEEIQLKILKTRFHISKNNNRMAYQLQEKISNKTKGILSQPVVPGTVQLTPSGNLIILMKDAQTTGGYPRVLQLTQNSINKLAQKSTKDELFFQLVKN